MESRNDLLAYRLSPPVGLMLENKGRFTLAIEERKEFNRPALINSYQDYYKTARRCAMAD
jgi:hypothetical protein